MSVKMCVLGSGSSGNCTAIWSIKQGILIDCGGNVEDWKYHLRSVKLNHGRICGILITHGHGDHVNVKTVKFSFENDIPIYINKSTYKKLLKKLKSKNMKLFRLTIKNRRNGLIKLHSNKSFKAGYFKIIPFKTHHKDIKGQKTYIGKSYGFCIHIENRKISYVTDTKKITHIMIKKMLNSDAIVLETNHDSQIVRDNPPQHPRWREHLSNDKAGFALAKMINKSTKADSFKRVFLAHVSEDNNTPKRPKMVVKRILREKGINSIKLIDTYKYERTRIYTV